MNKNEKQPAPRLRWKKDKSLTDDECSGAPMYGSYLHDGDVRIASISPIAAHGKWRGGWFWIARCDAAGVQYKTTIGAPDKTEADAKKAAMEYVKTCMAKRGEK